MLRHHFVPPGVGVGGAERLGQREFRLPAGSSVSAPTLLLLLLLLLKIGQANKWRAPPEVCLIGYQSHLPD